VLSLKEDGDIFQLMNRIAFAFLLSTFTTSIGYSQVTFNGSAITIVDNAQAAPSVISISGYTGIVTKVTLKFNGFTHSYTDDVAALLTGPNQTTQHTLLFDGPGLSPAPGTSVSGLNLTFDDAATATLPENASFGSGSYKPGLNQYNDFLGTPAPTGPYNADFNSFNGSFTNGNYTLYLGDFGQDHAGSIDSWSLTVFGITPVPEPASVLFGVGIIGLGARSLRRRITK
jgi:hypothetical protein